MIIPDGFQVELGPTTATITGPDGARVISPIPYPLTNVDSSSDLDTMIWAHEAGWGGTLTREEARRHILEERETSILATIAAMARRQTLMEKIVASPLFNPFVGKRPSEETAEIIHNCFIVEEDRSNERE